MNRMILGYNCSIDFVMSQAIYITYLSNICLIWCIGQALGLQYTSGEVYNLSNYLPLSFSIHQHF